MPPDTVLVAGGSGSIGTATVEHLNEHGYETVVVDRTRSRRGDRFVEADLLEPGDVYGAVTTSSPDAIVHVGTVPKPTDYTRTYTYESTVRTTFNLLEAASALEVETVCIASSINVLGKTYQDAPMDLEYLPIDESHPLSPRDPYGLGKHVAEVTADGFGRLSGPPVTISSLRFPLVRGTGTLVERFGDTDRSLESIREHRNPGDNELFAYLHVDDAASLLRCAIEAEFQGHESFWAAARDTTSSARTTDLVSALFPAVDVRGDLAGRASLIDTTKTRRMLGWEPTFSWYDP